MTMNSLIKSVAVAVAVVIAVNYVPALQTITGGKAS